MPFRFSTGVIVLQGEGISQLVVSDGVVGVVAERTLQRIDGAAGIIVADLDLPFEDQSLRILRITLQNFVIQLRGFIDPIGYLGLYGTGFGYRIVPTVARVSPGFKLTINPSEVVDAFEVPLAFLMNPENHQIHMKEFRGMERSYYAMPFAERYIWGATAGILRVLYERIYLA